MQDKNRLVLLFAVVGFFATLCGTVFLWFFVGASAPVVLGFRHLWLYFTFPLVGAASAALWALPVPPSQFGATHGALVGILTFVTVCTYVCALGAGLPSFFAYVSFGFILFGWLGVIAGAITGRAFWRTLNHRAR